ncbi:hypothetical protein [Streptomyces mirabilis]|uniref:hypothetical protein n=1 Tax=Streptomyces mirabilis TaxID=68239 RepID=UPI00367CCF34
MLAPGGASADLQRQVGRLSALLGNLAFHLEDFSGARTHLATAAAYADRCGDAALAAWTYGALSMVTRSTGNLTAALTYAERGAAAAPRGQVRVQLHAWALLPTLALQGLDREATSALEEGLTELEADPVGEAPGRFGFDAAELALHQAEAHLALGRFDQACSRAESSAATRTIGTPDGPPPPSSSPRRRLPPSRPTPPNEAWTCSTAFRPAAFAPPPAPGSGASTACSLTARPTAWATFANAWAPCRRRSTPTAPPPPDTRGVEQRLNLREWTPAWRESRGSPRPAIRHHPCAVSDWMEGWKNSPVFMGIPTFDQIVARTSDTEP